MRKYYDNYKFTEKLAPCPFCGDEIVNKPIMEFHKQTPSHRDHYTISCSDCGAEPNFYSDTELEAIEFWNRRPTLSPSNEFMIGFDEAKRKIIELIQNLSSEYKSTMK